MVDLSSLASFLASPEPPLPPSFLHYKLVQPIFQRVDRHFSMLKNGSRTRSFRAKDVIRCQQALSEPMRLVQMRGMWIAKALKTEPAGAF